MDRPFRLAEKLSLPNKSVGLRHPSDRCAAAQQPNVDLLQRIDENCGILPLGLGRDLNVAAINCTFPATMTALPARLQSL